MSIEIDCIGFVKYEGKRLESGAFDAQKSAKAILGFDEILRSYLYFENPGFKDIDFEIPVKVEKGSWLVSLPNDIEALLGLGNLVKAGATIIATTYISTAAKKMAENDFRDIGIKDLFKKGIEATGWVVKIGKHLGGILQRKFENIKVTNETELVGIPNAKGEILYVPLKYYEYYVQCNPKILEKFVRNLDPTIKFSIGVVRDGKLYEEIIAFSDRDFFIKDESEINTEFIFPELIHGAHVELEGEVTRENKTSNSMGFKYKDHILTAHPSSGSIIPFKPMLFDNCILVGYVDRIDENGRVGAKKPKLIFSELIPKKRSNVTGDLF